MQQQERGVGHLRKKEYLGKSRFGKRDFHQGEVDPKFPQGDMVRGVFTIAHNLVGMM